MSFSRSSCFSAMILVSLLCFSPLLGNEETGTKIDIGDVEINIGNSPRPLINDPDNWFTLRAGMEIGYIAVLNNKIQLGSDGTVFDYVQEGGQNNLYRFNRYSAEMDLGRRHTVIFLFQPLDITTQAVLNRDVIVDDLTFPRNTPVKVRYGFDFYRISYLYDFWKSKSRDLALGLSFQLRNAAISFESLDGSLLRSNQNVGPVPIFKFRAKLPLGKKIWTACEADGFYASGRYITGSENDFLGAILDASLRLGFELSKSFDSFLNLRYIGGGARGTEQNSLRGGDGFTDNWLHTFAISLGTYIK